MKAERPGCGAGLRRHQLDPRRRARGRQAAHPGRACRGGPALVQPPHAGGDQPHRRRPAQRRSCSARPGLGVENLAAEGHRRRRAHGRRRHVRRRRCMPARPRGRRRASSTVSACRRRATRLRPCIAPRTPTTRLRLAAVLAYLRGAGADAAGRPAAPSAHARAPGTRQGLAFDGLIRDRAARLPRHAQLFSPTRPASSPIPAACRRRRTSIACRA